MGLELCFCAIAVTREESIPPDKKVPKGTSEMAMAAMNQQNGGFIAPLIATLGATLLPSVFKAITGNGMYRAGQEASGLYRAKGLKNSKNQVSKSRKKS